LSVTVLTAFLNNVYMEWSSSIVSDFKEKVNHDGTSKEQK